MAPMELFDVLPAFPTSHLGDKPQRDPKHLGKLNSVPLFFRIGAYKSGLIFGNQSARISFANGIGSVSDSVGIVFLAGSPAKVLNSIIESVAIVVRHFMVFCWGLADKASRNKPMQRQLNPLPISKEGNHQISAAGLCELSQPTFPAYKSVIADHVIRGERDLYPFPVSHSTLYKCISGEGKSTTRAQ